ncbi:MAG: zinc-dependent alcohol dehydrogenase [Halodesulfurarchaeum sp.]
MDRQTLYFTAPFEVERRETNFDVAEDQVLVETALSAISGGTELLIYRGDAPTDRPADETLDALDGDLSYPLRYGYSAVGDVIEAGSAVSDEWVGRTVFAFNPHESRFAARPGDLVPVPNDSDMESFALLPSVETATSLVLDGRPRVGERVVVFGAGIVGLCTISLLTEFPLESLLVVEPIPDRREYANRLGADVAVSPDDVSRGVASFDGSGADLVYELSGTPEALDAAIDAAGYDSRVVVGSWYGNKDAKLSLGTDFHRGRISIESSQVSTISPELRGRFSKERRMNVALETLRTLDAGSLITHRIPFDDASEAYRLLDERAALQILLTYR